MTLYFATSHPTPVQAYVAWEKKREEWEAQREKLGAVFGGKASSMFCGTRVYVGGIKLTGDEIIALDPVHWCKKDQWGFSDLRRSPKLPKGMPKELRDSYRAAHDRLKERWEQHCPKPIDSHELWKGLGLINGGLQLGGMRCFELNGTVFLSSAEDVRSEIPGAEEILGTKFNEMMARFKAGEGRRDE